VNQAETIGAYGREISADYPSFTAASVMVETAEKLAGGETSPQQYLLLVGGLRSLANSEHTPGLILDSYLLRALSVAGWAPTFADCARCGTPGRHRNEPTTELLGALLAGEWEIADASDERSRAAASGVVSAYSQWHIDRGLKSLQHVERS
jgi:DNA repair protein RecO (recombination protein O)